eukprot:CAMPEP_0181331592 /NCGR_PEP_ID=MMETSP1101-20121128/24590_1 /TAXON_ID=46948 /ORGANISM="Rhodomonas abbreviata, Strain Caron Lab Isolate" /LENGTH=124 /DNA_ID=CAMNT_0023441075 /DNA_START=63 /DNA_END=437 /DNA_ORIENTATION=+
MAGAGGDELLLETPSLLLLDRRLGLEVKGKLALVGGDHDRVLPCVALPPPHLGGMEAVAEVGLRATHDTTLVPRRHVPLPHVLCRLQHHLVRSGGGGGVGVRGGVDVEEDGGEVCAVRLFQSTL